MLVITGVITLAFGVLLFVGQLISTLNFDLAQKLGLQENSEHAEPLFSKLELNTAIWDVMVFWLVPVTGFMMIIDGSWWALFALLTGGILLDAGGREIAKWLGLRSKGVKTGTEKDFHTAQIVLGFSSILGVWLIIVGLVELA